MVKYFGKKAKKNEAERKEKGSIGNMVEQTEKFKEDEDEKGKVQEEQTKKEEENKEEIEEEIKELKEGLKEAIKEENKEELKEGLKEEPKEEEKKEEFEKEIKIESKEEAKKDEIKIEKEKNKEDSKNEKHNENENTTMNQLSSPPATQVIEASSTQIKESIQENMPKIIKLRRYILANPSSFDYKAIIQIASKCLSYSCSSEYIRYVKAGNHEQVVVLPIIEKEGESKEYYEDSVTINVEVVDMTNIDKIQRVGTVKKSKSVEMISDSSNANKQKVSEYYLRKDDEGQRVENVSDAIEIVCPSCHKSNYIRDKDSYTCKYCKSLLLE